MKVLKFGGTSVGTPQSVANVKMITESTPGRKVVVVSALGGVTDLLINTARMAKEDDPSYLEGYAKITSRHLEMVRETVLPEYRETTEEVVRTMLEELGNIFQGIRLLKDLSVRATDIVLSYGERLSSLIISKSIKGAKFFDSRKFIRTKTTAHGTNSLDSELTNNLVKEAVGEDDWTIAVTGGFLATNEKGDTTNLGRGGSDYTAAIIAAALDAEMLEIWTDVDGFMTADPRIIDNAYVIDELTFAEATELCNFGAKVIYPPTIYPVYHKDIPIMVKNTFNPSARGTLISNRKRREEKPIKGISSINDTALVTIYSLCMVGVIGVNSRIFNALTGKGVSVFLVSQAASENNTTIAVRNADADLAAETLREEFSAELSSGMFNGIKVARDLATVAVVGANMKRTTGIAGKLFNTIGRSGINVIACAQGALETNISFVIEKKSLRKALNVIHDSFFLSANQVLNIFIIGIGNVGKSLISQIDKQKEKLLAEKNLRLNVVGIASSKKALFNRSGIDLKRYAVSLEEEGMESTPETIKEEVMKMNIYNPVFVDCTSSEEIADLYQTLLENNVNVVAANKTAASGDFSKYLELKETARKKDVKFLFETNVGAGLPIINTINSLINSGDNILKIEAVVSGTLNFIFNVLDKDIPLSRAVKMAKESGYTEPDPRVDLSGDDVVKKLVILAREAGYEINRSDVRKEPFIPEQVMTGEGSSFTDRLKKIDKEMEEKRVAAASKGEKFRYVASFDNGKGHTGLRSVGQGHPFYNLEGSNNVILLTTERYKEYPMIIKGYGAGAEVTAAGVFADIISIANIR